MLAGLGVILLAVPVAGALKELDQEHGGGGGGGGGCGDGLRHLLMKSSSNSSAAVVYEQNHAPFTFTIGSSIALALVFVVSFCGKTTADDGSFHFSHACLTSPSPQCSRHPPHHPGLRCQVCPE